MSGYQPGDQVDKYIIERILGEGGMAYVYKARHASLDIPFALKMPKNTHGYTIERLIREANVQARLQHPNIVSLVDLLDVEGSPCLVMEYVKGLPLNLWLSRNKTTLDLAEKIFEQIVDAVDEAHSLGIIHRDLKPSNILVEKRRDQVFVKVCDFGVAKALGTEEPNFTRTGVTLGTPAYMAPEQVRNAKNVDRRCDVFSLGTLFYEILTNQQAFVGSDTLDLLNAVANNPHIPPERYIPDLPERVLMMINGALEKIPSKRIPDCRTLRSVLKGTTAWKSSEITLAGMLKGESDNTQPFNIESRDTLDTSGMNDQSNISIESTVPLPAHFTEDEELTQDVDEVVTKSSWFLPLVAIVSVLLGVMLGMDFLDSGAKTPTEKPTAEGKREAQKRLQQVLGRETDEPSNNLEQADSTINDTTKQSESSNPKQNPDQNLEERTNTDPSKTQQENKIVDTPVTDATNPENRENKSTQTEKQKTTDSTKTDSNKKPPKIKQDKKVSKTARVTFSGAQKLRLYNSKGSYFAGRGKNIPEGSYTMMATFEGSEVQVGRVTLKTGDSIHYSCKAFFKRCTIE